MKSGFDVSLACIACAALLQACGGGGGGGTAPFPAATAEPSPDTPSQSDPGPTPSEEAPRFVATDAAEYLLVGPSTRAEDLSGFEQNAKGAMTRLENLSLSGDFVVANVEATTEYAMGRWVDGTVTYSGGEKPQSYVLRGDAEGSSFHYLVFNPATSWPETGEARCDAGVFSTPTYDRGNFNDPMYYAGEPGAHSGTGTASGSAQLRFENGPQISGEITVVADGASGTVLLEPEAIVRHIQFVPPRALSGSYFQNSSNNSFGAETVLASAARGFYLMSGYATVLSNGARYVGVARFHCE